MNKNFKIGTKLVGIDQPTYFIADIAANHDGDIEKAKDLIHSSAEAGADAAKFQHFEAETIVSDYGFKSLGKQQSHQALWKKSVYEVYKDASLPKKWTPILKKECDKAGIEFFTSPYSLELVDYVDQYLNVYKVGSGDVTWHEIVIHMASKKKPIIIATGASNLKEVQHLVNKIQNINNNLCLMQCNTNYTAEKENFKYINLNVLKKYKDIFPNILLGLSDHTLGHTTVLGAVTLGARVIEKHYTLNNDSVGPDHKFSMNYKTWKEMISATRELEYALGDGEKKVEDNEKETVVLQRRAIRLKNKLKKGHKIGREDLIMLRPCPMNAIEPHEVGKILKKKLNKDLNMHQEIKWSDLD